MTKAPLPSGWIRARLYHFFAPLVALGLFVALQRTDVVDLVEYLTVNLRFQARAPFDPPADPRLIFVGIDQQSLDKFGRYPWPRTVIAKFLTELAQTGAAPHTVAFDILYTDKSDKPQDDIDLGDAVGLLPSVITGALSSEPSGDPSVVTRMENETRHALANAGPTEPLTRIHGDPHKIRGFPLAIIPVEPVRKQSLFGFVNDDPDIDGIRHRIPLIVRVEDRIYPSLALQTLCQILHIDNDKISINVGQNITLQDSAGKSWTIPMNAEGEYYINYRRSDPSNNTFNTLSMGLLCKELEESIANGTPLDPKCDFKQKTLLIGQAATALIDLGPTPLQARSPLPYTHLNVINNVLTHDYVRFVPGHLVALVWLITAWITLFRLKDAPLLEAVGVPLALMVVYTAVSFAIFWKWSLQIALAWPVIGYGAVNFGAVVLRWREEQQGREEIKGLFSRMLSPEVMNHLMNHPENLKLGGSERPATVLFSDIRDYTKFSEGLPATEVVRQLNVYFERMVDCVKQCQGTLHKYIGDAIMAAWGDIAVASLGPEKDAQNAVRSALMMRRKLRELNEERKAANLTPLRIGIGLNHGDVLVGLIGASSRSEFTVMGDPVNTASRLEGMTKEFHTDLAISESVCDLIGDDFLVRRLGLIQLKGKTKPTVVYEVLAEKSSLAESKMIPEMVALYEEAFDHFLARRFSEAEAGFLDCGQKYPDDFCVQNYLMASRAFRAEPPPSDWDGRIVMTTK